MTYKLRFLWEEPTQCKITATSRLNLFGFGLDGWWLDASEPEGDPLRSDETFLGPGKAVRNAYPVI
jgi:alpha-D-xyloside xylohydrolase